MGTCIKQLTENSNWFHVFEQSKNSSKFHRLNQDFCWNNRNGKKQNDIFGLMILLLITFSLTKLMLLSGYLGMLTQFLASNHFILKHFLWLNVFTGKKHSPAKQETRNYKSSNSEQNNFILLVYKYILLQLPLETHWWHSKAQLLPDFQVQLQKNGADANHSSFGLAGNRRSDDTVK